MIGAAPISWGRVLCGAGRPFQKNHLAVPRYWSNVMERFVHSFTSKDRSDTAPPHLATANEGGRFVLGSLRSILSHPLGLPLTAAWNGQTTKFLKKDFTVELDDQFESLFKRVYNETTKQTHWKEKDLTSNLEEPISGVLKGFEVVENRRIKTGKKDGEETDQSGLADIALVKDSLCAVVEFGLDVEDVWKKLHQNSQYIKGLCQEQVPDNKNLEFSGDKPILFAVTTVENRENNFRFRQAVFLLSRKETGIVPVGTLIPDDHFRTALIGTSYETNIDNASKAFGRLLWTAANFAEWRDQPSDNHWQYLGPNCCSVVTGENGSGNTHKLVCYDNRLWKTERKPGYYYRHPQQFGCQTGKDLEVLQFRTPDGGRESNSWNAGPKNDMFKGDKTLLVIGFQYLEGSHIAGSPAAFVPIVVALDDMHENDEVHGDIRGFNLVFGEHPHESWIIDYDFSGKVGVKDTRYPKRYQKYLPDGTRMGKEGEAIEKWHDWYALGRVIFDCHRFLPPPNHDPELERKRSELSDFWRDIGRDVTKKEVEQLKTFLQDLGEANWTAVPSSHYKEVLDELDEFASQCKTGPNATGSPKRPLFY